MEDKNPLSKIVDQINKITEDNRRLRDQKLKELQDKVKKIYEEIETKNQVKDNSSE